jgi:hypothetical protein
VTSLVTFGGFPEPLLLATAKDAARWRLGYAERLVREDIRDLERVRELERVELLYDRLGAVAGSVLSIDSLREDLEVAFETVRRWIAILERLDAVFRVSRPALRGSRVSRRSRGCTSGTGLEPSPRRRGSRT